MYTLSNLIGSTPKLAGRQNVQIYRDEKSFGRDDAAQHL